MLEMRAPRLTDKIWEGMRFLEPMSHVDLTQVYLRGRIRSARALFRAKVDGLVPRSQHVKLWKVDQPA